MCTVPGVNQTAVNKYINNNNKKSEITLAMHILTNSKDMSQIMSHLYHLDSKYFNNCDI